MAQVEQEQVADVEGAPIEGELPEEGFAVGEPGVEEDAAIEGDDDDEDGEQDDDDEPTSAADDFQEDAPRPVNAADVEKLHERIEKANLAHVAKIGRIMGDDATALIPCPVCMDFVAGLIFPPEVAPLPEPVKSRMKELLGLDSWEDTPTVAWAQQCPDCRGRGEVRTGSWVNGKETTRCLTCGGDGWRNTRNEAAAPPHGVPVPSETGPTVYGQETENDPDVDYLRSKGYTVIPPMQPVSG